MTRGPTHDTSTACTMCQLRARRVNREHDTSTASTMRHLRARCVNREHNASTASTTRCSRTSHVCNALPASTMHRPAFTMRQPACNNNDAVLPRLLCVVSHVVEPNDASTVGTTRQPPRERRVNRGNDMSTVCTTRQRHAHDASPYPPYAAPVNQTVSNSSLLCSRVFFKEWRRWQQLCVM